MNLEKFKQLTLKKKIEWIIQYYGIWIAVSIIAIAVTISFVHSVFFPKPICDMCVVILSDDYTRDDAPNMEKEISTLIDGSVSIQIYNESELYGDSAFAVKVMSDQIDLIMAPKEKMDSMIQSSYILDYERLNSSGLYMASPVMARTGDKLDKTVEYFKEREMR